MFYDHSIISMETTQNPDDSVPSWPDSWICNQLEKMDKPTLVVVKATALSFPKLFTLHCKADYNSWLVQLHGVGHGAMHPLRVDIQYSK